MIIVDAAVLTGLATLLSSVAALVWAIRRKAG